MSLNILSNLAMLSLVLGTLPAYVALLKARGNLKGFSLLGTIGIFTGQLLFTIFFFLSNDYLTTALAIPLVIYWTLVLFFLHRSKIKGTLIFMIVGSYPDALIEFSINEVILPNSEYYCVLPLIGRIK